MDRSELNRALAKGHMSKLTCLMQRLRERIDAKRTERAERQHWGQAQSLADLGEVTARWLEGEIKYHPNGYDGGPDPETTDIIPALAALNRSGFVTNGSQPGLGPTRGYDGNIWWQRAAVEGFADTATADRLETTAADAGLIVIRHSGARWRCDYRAMRACTASDTPCGVERGHLHTHFGVRLSRGEVKLSFDGYLFDELCKAEQVTIIDPEWGRTGFLWSTLTGHTIRQTETRYSVNLWNPSGALHKSHSELTYDEVNELYAEHENTGYEIEITDWVSVDQHEDDPDQLTSGDRQLGFSDLDDRFVAGRPTLQWGLAWVDPDGAVHVSPADYDETGDERYPWIPAGPRGTVAPPAVYQHPQKGWIMAATGWPLPERVPTDTPQVELLTGRRHLVVQTDGTRETPDQ